MTMTLERPRVAAGVWTPPQLRLAAARQIQFRPTRLPRIAWALANPRIDETAADASAALGIDVTYDELIAACQRGQIVTAIGQAIRARPGGQPGVFLVIADAA
ncbi:hypothetical protein [Pseudoclavibacter sp. RFBA6]|uniref:hypothetical protein n=1 Tax=Pseudoclavibacter sp. RFBA6 TaxID=2080573 RepID=UPI0011B080CD|nr:hypothetical protein [Pseudoclavibacter sp. RFBA6]